MLTLLIISAIIGILLQITGVDAAKSAGCGKAVSSTLKRGGIGSSNTVSFTTSSGVKRTFLLHVPTKYDVNTATPLIFSFHGRGENGAAQENDKSKLSDESLNPNMFVVYPDGLPGTDGSKEWQSDPDAKGYNDVGFVLDMIGSLEDEFCIDTNRIYSSGHSNGGGFSLNILACNSTASQKIAAFMGSAPATYQGATDANCNPATVPITCNPGRKLIPILETHGSADTTIGYNGGPRRQRCLPSVPHFITEWAVRDGLSATNVTTSLVNGNIKQSSFGNGLVTSYWMNGLGHTWPWSYNGGWIDATPIVMAFFNKYSLGSTSSSSSSTASTQVASSSSTKATATTATSTAKTASSTSSTSTTSTSEASSILVSCPGSDNKIWTTTNGAKYTIHCGSDSTGKTIQGATYPGSFTKCIQACDVTSGCLSVSYTGACYLKGNAGTLISKSSMTYRVAVKL